ncbi:MAG: FG-GAP repeat domain-containing protein [Armatimonadota bacterium]
MRAPRLLLLITALAAAASSRPAAAQQMMRVLERGPVGFLHGTTLLQEIGNLTAGDFAHPAVADWDGDGRPDLVVGSGYGDLLLFARPAGGAFGPARALLPENGQPLAAMPQRMQVSPWLGDLDGDGQLDMLLGLHDRLYRYAVRDGACAEGRLIAGPGTPVILPPPLAPCAADLDGDGKTHIVIVDGHGRVHLLADESAAPVMVAGAHLQVAAPARAWAGDWDGDGRADLLIGAGDGRVVICRGDGKGLTAPEELGAASFSAGPQAAPWATDFDGDGDLDLLVGGRAGFVALVQRRGGGELAQAGLVQQQRAPIDVGRCAVATAGDWDGDGDADLVAGGEDGGVWLYERLPGAELLFGRGLQVAGEDGPVAAAGTGERRYAAPVLTDWDADGDLDLLVGGVSGKVLVWLNAGGLRAGGPLQVGGAPLRMAGIAMPAAADYNGDGDTDLFVGARPEPEGEGDTGVVLPQIAPGCAYFENTADRPGALPVFAKGVPVPMTLASREGELRRDGGFLAPYAIYPSRWRGPLTTDFITVSLLGTFIFTNTARPGAYACLEAQCEGRALPTALLPPLYSAVPAQLNGEPGLLAADCPYGFVCWYPRGALDG